jgi:hypothetical protein
LVTSRGFSRSLHVLDRVPVDPSSRRCNGPIHECTDGLNFIAPRSRLDGPGVAVGHDQRGRDSRYRHLAARLGGEVPQHKRVLAMHALADRVFALQAIVEVSLDGDRELRHVHRYQYGAASFEFSNPALGDGRVSRLKRMAKRQPFQFATPISGNCKASTLVLCHGAGSPPNVVYKR